MYVKGGGDEDMGGGAPKIVRHPKGELRKNEREALKICILQNQQEVGGGGGAPENMNR